MKTQFNNVLEILDYFKNESKCRKVIEMQRWGGYICCPFCNNQKVYRTNRGFKCANSECYKKFTITVGTIFENTKIKLRFWLAAIYLCISHKKGISSHQLSRDIGVSQKTAWFMLQRIREMLKEKHTFLKNIVEIDETYIGGLEANKHESKKDKTKKVPKKTVVFGIYERGGNIVTQVVQSTKVGDVIPCIIENVQHGSTLYTDDLATYARLSKFYKHDFVKHGKGEYKKGDVHTNNIENFWSHLKRGILGIYHSVSKQHLARYCNEYAFRYNTRKESDNNRFFMTLCRVGTARLKYNDLIAKC